MKFHAKLQGVDIDKKIKENEQIGLFKDPKEYENLPEEERKELTRDMMKQHKKKLG